MKGKKCKEGGKKGRKKFKKWRKKGGKGKKKIFPSGFRLKQRRVWSGHNFVSGACAIWKNVMPAQIWVYMHA